MEPALDHRTAHAIRAGQAGTVPYQTVQTDAHSEIAPVLKDVRVMILGIHLLRFGKGLSVTVRFFSFPLSMLETPWIL